MWAAGVRWPCVVPMPTTARMHVFLSPVLLMDAHQVHPSWMDWIAWPTADESCMRSNTFPCFEFLFRVCCGRDAMCLKCI